MTLVARAVWLALPVVLAGATHIFVIRRDLWPGLARVPLDGGATFRGRRVLGDHKTVRGAVVMAGVTVAFAGAQAALAACWPAAQALAFDHETHWLPWGLLLGIGYVVGELPNSFVKRQLDIRPGAAAPGLLAPLFWLADQLDSLVGVLCLMALAWVPPAAVVAALTLVTLAVHPAMALLMVALGLKQRVG
jgi:CDP-archaeol synthase